MSNEWASYATPRRSTPRRRKGSAYKAMLPHFPIILWSQHFSGVWDREQIRYGPRVDINTISRGAFDSAKNYKRHSVTAKREKSQTPKFV